MLALRGSRRALTPGGSEGVAAGALEATNQIELFGRSEETLRDAVAGIDVDSMTPLEALNRLHALVAEARREDG